MDDSSSTKGLSLDPDLMTATSGIPTVISSKTTTPNYSSGVIDITPGAPSISPTPTIQHIDTAEIPDHKIIDITPDGPISNDLISEGVSVLPSLSSTSTISTPPTDLSAQLADDLSQVDLSQPLSDIIHEVTPSSDIPHTDQITEKPSEINQSPIITSVDTALASLPDESVSLSPAISEPQVNLLDQSLQTPASVEESPVIQPVVTAPSESSPAPEINPLYEDPDLVKIIQ